EVTRERDDEVRSGVEIGTSTPNLVLRRLDKTVAEYPVRYHAQLLIRHTFGGYVPAEGFCGDHDVRGVAIHAMFHSSQERRDPTLFTHRSGENGLVGPDVLHVVDERCPTELSNPRCG